MATAAHIFAILGILSAPMISIAALVLTLAALNWSLGVRRLYVRILAFIFDYATKIKRDKELSIDTGQSSDEPSTPTLKTKTAKVAPPLLEKPPDDPIEITAKTSLVSDSKTEDESDSSQKTPTIDPDQKASGNPSQNDIQFKLGTIK
jgi:uncharacterized membrane protein YraQ (UPF0718 family)